MIIIYSFDRSFSLKRKKQWIVAGEDSGGQIWEEKSISMDSWFSWSWDFVKRVHKVGEGQGMSDYNSVILMKDQWI